MSEVIKREAIEERAMAMWSTMIATGDVGEGAKSIEDSPEQKLAFLHGIRLAAMAAVEIISDTGEA